MNTNNWLSFPLSPTHPSLQSHLQSNDSQPHQQFSLGLVSDHIDNPFAQAQGNLMSYFHLMLYISYYTCNS